jgi:DNA polymerase-1
LAAWRSGLKKKIVTGDRDLLQLVTNRIIVSLPNTKTSVNEDYFPEDVVRRMGVKPEQVVDYKALVGDTSDNIPGVRGIGEKTAITLIDTYQTLDNIYAHVDEIKGSLQVKLREGRRALIFRRIWPASAQTWTSNSICTRPGLTISTQPR